MEASVLMMPSMPLLRARKEDKISELDQYVRAEYGESCAGWIASGLELEAGMTLPRARSSESETLSRSRDAGQESRRRKGRIWGLLHRRRTSPEPSTVMISEQREIR